MEPPPGPASPVPAHSTPLLLIASAPTACVICVGHTLLNRRPASVLCQTPPLAVATYTLSRRSGSTTTSSTRPPMLVGPFSDQVALASPGSLFAVVALICWACALAFCQAPVGMTPPRWPSISSPGSVAWLNIASSPAAVTPGTCAEGSAVTRAVGVAARTAGIASAGKINSRRERRMRTTSPYAALVLLLRALLRLQAGLLLAPFLGRRLPDRGSAAQRLTLLLGELGRERRLAVALLPVEVQQGRQVVLDVVDRRMDVAELGEPLAHRPDVEVGDLHPRDLLPGDRRGDRRLRPGPDAVSTGDRLVARHPVEVEEDPLAALLLPPLGRRDVRAPAFDLARDGDRRMPHVDERVDR